MKLWQKLVLVIATTMWSNLGFSVYKFNLKILQQEVHAFPVYLD